MFMPTYIDTSGLLMYPLTAERSCGSEHYKQAVAVTMAYKRSEGLDFFSLIPTHIGPHWIQEYDSSRSRDEDFF